MMSKIKENKILTIASILALVGIITIAYAVFTSSLNINGTGINRKSTFDIYFNNVSNFLTTGTAIVTDPNPTVRNHTTVIEDYEATLVSPTDSIYFTFDIVNDGDYDATLTSLTLGPVKCSVNGNESDTSATNVCSNIEYTMKYTSDNSNVSVNDTLASKETKEVKVTLTYKDFSDSSKLPTNNVTISNLGIDMVYTADTTAKTNSDGSTPYDPYPIGKEVTIQSEKYNVIGQGDDYVTLLKQQPLTANEINTYGGVGTENNHVNMYLTDDTSSSYYHQAFDYVEWGDTNHTGGMAYYTSSSCGKVNGSWIYSGCTTDYNSSEVKYVVDAWAADKFTNELKTVDGYSARLVQKEELRAQFYPSCSETATSCSKESTTPSWLHNFYYIYWTMTPRNSSSFYVWYVGFNSYLNYYYGCGIDGAVRPVINVYKSKLS